MGRPLREDSSQTVQLGPFFDITDPDTVLGSLTLANTDIKLSKAGNPGTFVNKNSGGGTSPTHGFVSVTFNATDLADAGPLLVVVPVASALLYWECFDVHPQQVFDSLYGTDKLQVDVKEIDSRSSAAVLWADSCETILSGTVTTAGGAPTTTVFSTSLTAIANDRMLGRLVLFRSGAAGAAYDGGIVSDFVQTNGVITLANAMNATPSNGDPFVVL